MVFNNTKYIKRIAIYSFNDKDGIVDRYVPKMLADIKQNVDTLCVVCNGNLSEEGRSTLNQYSDLLLVRENEGFDIWGYRAGMLTYGWEELMEYDEIVLLNDTLMGPLYPLFEMFNTMMTRDVDFWGLSKCYKEDLDRQESIEYDYIPEHIQSFFIVFRGRLLQNEDFQKHWENLPKMLRYEETVDYHEAIFTKKFEDKGFQSDTYLNYQKYEKFNVNPFIYYSKELIEEQRCPVFKRDNFFTDYTYLFSQSLGQSSYKLMNYLKEETEFDFTLILDNILRLNNLSDLKNTMHQNRILSKRVQFSKTNESRSVAVIMHMYYIDLFSQNYTYLSMVPSYADLYIIVDSEDKKTKVESFFAYLPCKSMTVLICENRGRDVNALLVTCRDIVPKYEYVCFAHDKNARQIKPSSIGESLAYRYFENTLGSKIFIENILQTFDDNSRLGLMTAPPPNHSIYSSTIATTWSENFEATKKLLDDFGVNVNITEEKSPVAPLGSMFWFRSKAILKLLDYKWTYEDFPQEPLVVDGTISCAIDRSYSYFAQDAGYYSERILNNEYAGLELTNLKYMIDLFYKALVPFIGATPNWEISNRIMSETLIKKSKFIVNLKNWLKKNLPKPILIWLKRIKQSQS